MKSFRSLPAFIVAAVGLAGGSSLHAQMPLNGSFEDPALAGDSDVLGSGADWTPTGNSMVFTNGAGLGRTPYGNQWELLETTSTDTQTITGFTPNTPCILSLAAADVFGDTDDQLTIMVSGGATATQSFAIPTRSSGPGNTPLPFATYTLDFTPATEGAVTITIIIADGFLAVDNVQLSVPEPSTWALLGFGMVGAGVVTLRRRQHLP